MASYTDYRYQFNGVVSTDKTVMQNLESMCTASGCWPAYDIHTGKWSVVINKEGTSVASFTDSNIIGPITVNGTGLTQLYNKVKVQFPHIDLNDNPDYTIIEIPSIDRNANEPDNTLNMQLDVINDPVQAQLIGGINLKQSRVDKVIRFMSDFSKMGLKAGDLIDITSTVYGFTSKMFRITSIIERDADDGSIQLDITALEYDANVYDTSDLSRYVVSNSTGIVTIGSIGTPGLPTVTKYELDRRPGLLIKTTAPTGIVEGIEFWLTKDVPPANNVDSTRNYKLLGTVKPKIGTSFNFGDEVELDYDTLDPGNFLIKVRGINSTTTGPYSAPAGIIYYAPQQVTDAIGPDTVAIDATGALLTTLAVNYLLNHLDDVWQGISDPGSLFDKIIGIYDDLTGADLKQIGTNTATNGYPVALETFELTSSTSTLDTIYNAFAGPGTWGTPYPGSQSNPAHNVVTSFDVTVGMKQMLLILQTPLGSFDFEYKAASGTIYTRTGVYAYFPSVVQVFKDSVKIQETTVDWQTQTSIMQVEAAGPGFYEIWITALPTYDLDQNGSHFIYPYNFSCNPQASGGGITITGYFFR